MSVLWLHIVTCEACVHTPHSSQYAAITLKNVLYSLYVSTFNQVCNF